MHPTRTVVDMADLIYAVEKFSVGANMLATGYQELPARLVDALAR